MRIKTSPNPSANSFLSLHLLTLFSSIEEEMTCGEGGGNRLMIKYRASFTLGEGGAQGFLCIGGGANTEFSLQWGRGEHRVSFTLIEGRTQSFLYIKGGANTRFTLRRRKGTNTSPFI